MVRIFITDDHPIVLEGLKNVLNATEGFAVTGTCSTGKETLEAFQEKEPDILLLDINLPDINGVELCAEVKKKHPDVYVIALSVHNEAPIINSMLRQGASGYIQKNALSDIIVAAIRDVLKGGSYVCEQSREILRRQSGKGGLTQLPKMTRREKEILKLAAEGLTIAQIAEQLFISPYTVESHRKNLMDKFEVNSVAAAIKLAGQYGFL
ncbi:two component transcriptional regulator, LuxR family [Chitinophaga sp. YR627]|uniref:response regulator n=1 Tax=Chitinophaga sp. YR627 TaxID=1881041 RepID=UPI0008F3FA55|nr:response regulator transcription factor [Chitinophaga sp. YR627]SFM81366.1 two component transcriptional regulator, LuxR family [Chitinophaga sp. YR627]